MKKRFKFAARALVVLVSATAAHGEGVVITPADVAAMAEKVGAASSFVDATWATIFGEAGHSYSAPRLVPFVHSVNTGCGVLPPDNAHYCGTDNAVYYDIEFFAKLSKYTGRELRTDGSYAPITVLWHEIGHGVARNSGHQSGILTQSGKYCRLSGRRRDGSGGRFGIRALKKAYSR